MEQTLAELENAVFDLIAAFNQYDHILKNGELGWSWTDGHALNVVRKKIVAAKERVGSYVSETYPDVCKREIPELKSELFMLRADEIVGDAKKTLEAIQQSEDYDYLIKNIAKLEKEQRIGLKADGMIDKVEQLGKLIRTNQAVKLKKYADQEKYLRELKACRKQLEEALNEQEELKPLKVKEPETVTVTATQQGLLPGMETLISKEEYFKNPYEELHKELLRYGNILTDVFLVGENNVRIRLIEYGQEKYLDYMKDGKVIDIAKGGRLVSFTYQPGKEKIQ